MEKITEIVINKLLQQRDSLIGELRNLNQNEMNWELKYRLLETQISNIGFKINEEMCRLERFENTLITSKND